MKPVVIDSCCGLGGYQVYLITCWPNGKCYVGITSNGLRRRWSQHVGDAKRHPCRTILYRAINKYGTDSFQIESVCWCRSWEDACFVETVLIEQHGTLQPSGYNLTTGGEGRSGYRPTPESVERSAAKHRGKPCHPNTRIAASLTHRNRPKTPQHRQKIAASKRGKPRSPETRAKLSIAKLGISVNIGARNPGAKLTPDQIACIRKRLDAGAVQRHLAAEFGVSTTAIWKVAHGLKWKSLP